MSTSQDVLSEIIAKLETGQPLDEVELAIVIRVLKSIKQNLPDEEE
jgi:hypothetical protein